MVETAIVLPLLLLFILGIIEFGRAVMVQQILTNAAREGARQATLPGTSTAVVEAAVEGYLDNTSVSGASRTVQVLDINGSAVEVASAPTKSPVVVYVSVPHDEISFGLTQWLGSSVLSARVVMRRE